MFWLPITIGIIIAIIAIIMFLEDEPGAGTIIGLFALVFLVSGSISGATLGEGDYSGTIVSVERSGLIWTTTSIAIKSDAGATEPEWFCTTNPEVEEQLRAFAESGERVRVHFVRHAFFSDGCEFEASKRIVSVEATQ